MLEYLSTHNTGSWCIFVQGHQRKYLTLLGCNYTEESRGLFDLKLQAVVGQLASVSKVLTDSGRGLPAFDIYFFQRPSDDEHACEDDQDATEFDDGNYSDDLTDVVQKPVSHAYDDFDGHNASEEDDD